MGGPPELVCLGTWGHPRLVVQTNPYYFGGKVVFQIHCLAFAKESTLGLAFALLDH